MARGPGRQRFHDQAVTETYSALGYGDLFPLGYLRLIASVSPLNGSLLLAWSGSFLFLLIRDNFIDNFVP